MGGWRSSVRNPGVGDSTASLDDLAVADKLVDLSDKVGGLSDKVGDLDAEIFSKHSELQQASYHNCEELTRGMAYLRGFVEHKVKASEKKLAEKLDNEIAKNAIKDKAFKDLLKRVESLEGVRLGSH